MNRFIKFAIFVFSLLVGFTIGTLGFRYLPEIPVFSNPWEIDSPLVRQNFHPFNNTLRFLLLLLSPIVVWLFLAKRIKALQTIDPSTNSDIPNWILRFIQIFCLFFGLTYLLQATIFQDFKLDGYYFFHEGEWLAPAWKWFETKEIWRGSFFAHGAFYDALSSAMAWKLFGVVSIGASRIFTLFLEKFVFFAVFLLIVCVSRFAYSKIKNNLLQTTAILLMTSYFVVTFQDWHNFERRDLPVLFGFILFTHALVNRNRLSLFVASFLAFSSWIYSIDRGAYFSFAIFTTIIFLGLLTRDWKNTKQEIQFALFGFLSGTLFFILLLGKEEMFTFLQTSKALLSIKDLSDGSKYPAPGFPIINLKFLLSRHTIPLLNLSIQTLSLFVLCYRSKFKLNKDPLAIIEIALWVIAVVYYRGALSRCDEVHYRYVASFGFIGVGFCLAKAIQTYSKPILIALSSLAFFSLCVQFKKNVDQFNPTFFSTYKAFALKPDSDFLYDWELSTLNYLKSEFQNEPCFYSVVSEPLWPYLLRKSYCGKFHLTWLISDKRLQFEAIEELKKWQPGKILVHTPRSGDEMDGIPMEQRVKYLYKYIQEHYKPHSSHEGWEVWKRI